MKADLETTAAIMAAWRRPFDAFVEGDVAGWLESCIPDSDMVWIGTGPEEMGIGPDRFRALLEDSLTGTSERSYDLVWETISSEGDAAWLVGEASISAKAGGRTIKLPFRYTAVL